MCNWKRWIWPGVLALAVLTALAALFRAEVVEGDLTAKALNDLSANHSWAKISADGRDLTLSGIAPSAEAVSDALGIADDAYDVRVVANATEIIPTASPFRLSVEKTAGKLVLSGSVPSDVARRAIVEAAKKAAPAATIEDKMVLARGEPAGFGALAGFAISRLSGLSEGRAELVDADLSVSGAAVGFDQYDQIVSTLAGSIPGGGVVKNVDITAPAANPFEWAADYDGTSVTLSGYVPGESARSAVVAAARSQLPNAAIVDKLRIASGAPADFAKTANYALSLLPNFSKGEVSLKGNAFSVTGTANSSGNYSNALAQVPKLPAGYTLARSEILPTGVSPYVWNASHDGKSLVLSGYVPGETARSSMSEAVSGKFAEMTITDKLEIAGGATDAYQAGTRYGLRMLNHLSGGKAELVDNRFSLTGRAKSFDSYDAVLAALNQFPGGLSRGEIFIRPPVVSSYKLMARKSGNAITMEGHMPSIGVRVAALAALRAANPGADVTDTTRIADGVTSGINWTDATRYALTMLGNLKSGSTSIIDGKYIVEGAARSASAFQKAKGILADGLGGGMKLAREAITGPSVAPPPPPPGNVAKNCQAALDTALSGKKVQFEVNRSVIKDGSKGLLNSLAVIAGSCPDARVEIAGHTDSDGSDVYNLKLSEDRAKAVWQYLVDAGIARQRLDAKGYGESRPVGGNDTDAGKAKNRRIEFRVIQ